MLTRSATSISVWYYSEVAGSGGARRRTEANCKPSREEQERMLIYRCVSP